MRSKLAVYFMCIAGAICHTIADPLPIFSPNSTWASEKVYSDRIGIAIALSTTFLACNNKAMGMQLSDLFQPRRLNTGFIIAVDQSFRTYYMLPDLCHIVRRILTNMWGGSRNPSTNILSGRTVLFSLAFGIVS